MCKKNIYLFDGTLFKNKRKCIKWVIPSLELKKDIKSKQKKHVLKNQSKYHITFVLNVFLHSLKSCILLNIMIYFFYLVPWFYLDHYYSMHLQSYKCIHLHLLKKKLYHMIDNLMTIKILVKITMFSPSICKYNRTFFTICWICSLKVSLLLFSTAINFVFCVSSFNQAENP